MFSLLEHGKGTRLEAPRLACSKLSTNYDHEVWLWLGETLKRQLFAVDASDAAPGARAGLDS